MEFLEYEKALVKYHSGLSIRCLPLISWDIFSQNFTNKQDIILDNSSINKIQDKNNWSSKWDYNFKLENNTVIVVTDASLKIVFASKNMVKMNGYVPKEVIGNNTKMFQGEQTDLSVSNEIRLAIQNQEPFEKVVVNYCKDGSTYKCHIKGYPIFNQKGKLINFIAFEKIAA